MVSAGLSAEAPSHIPVLAQGTSRRVEIPPLFEDRSGQKFPPRFDRNPFESLRHGSSELETASGGDTEWKYPLVHITGVHFGG